MTTWDQAPPPSVGVSLSDQFLYARMQWDTMMLKPSAIIVSRCTNNNNNNNNNAMTSPADSRSKRRRKTRDESTTTFTNLFERLPTELVEHIFKHVEFAELHKLCRINKAFNNLLSQPHMYPVIHLTADDPRPKPTEFLIALTRVLHATRDLTLRSFSTSHLSFLLPNVSDRLTRLDLSFSTVTDNLLRTVAQNGSLINVNVVKLKACRGVHDVEWLAHEIPRVEHLDLSWSGVSSLPTTCGLVLKDDNKQVQHQRPEHDQIEDDIEFDLGSDDSGFFDVVSSPSTSIKHDDDNDTDNAFQRQSTMQKRPFSHLKHLSLSSVFYLPTSSLVSFFQSLPPTLETLDLSYTSLSFQTLSQLRLTKLDDQQQQQQRLRGETNHIVGQSQLQQLDLTGNDRLTLKQLDKLKTLFWNNNNNNNNNNKKCLNVIHSPLLDSDDEEDVRRFVEMLARIHG
ncbi:hypothetical protein OIO90_005121 [Microbotryomycetes sp. JL221]|nr:hypothetical protein OIO90_005121 [Microbotryomycetes sp. JL221]